MIRTFNYDQLSSVSQRPLTSASSFAVGAELVTGSG